MPPSGGSDVVIRRSPAMLCAAADEFADGEERRHAPGICVRLPKPLRYLASTRLKTLGIDAEHTPIDILTVMKAVNNQSSPACPPKARYAAIDVARWAALSAGFPDSVPAITVNRFCASSLSGAISIAHAIRAEELSIGLAAGVESMSRSGWALMKGDAPFSPRGPVFMLDTMWAGAGGPPHPALLARNAYVEMIKTAQNVADRYELTREEIDAFALRSHRKAAAARDSGRFAEQCGEPVKLEWIAGQLSAAEHEPATPRARSV